MAKAAHQPPFHQPEFPTDLAWPYWPVVPLYPYGQRRTLCRELIPNRLWTFDQVQGILYVVVPIRMTVVKLDAGGLFVYAPVAPTPECLRLMDQLVQQHGDVKYIILPTVSGIEHKVFVGPFARHFPEAQVYVSPHQWSFPLNLPLSWLGLPGNRTHRISPTEPTPFAGQIDYACLGPIELGIGPFEEIACFDRATQTLLITDTVLSVSQDPPEHFKWDPYPLLFHARDHVFDVVEDSDLTRQRGWQRIVLFSLYFRPSALDVVEARQALQEARRAPDRSRKAFWGFYPFSWTSRWKGSFEALCQPVLVAPILQRLIFNRGSEQVLQWADQVAAWNFEQIVSCHFQALLDVKPEQFRAVFRFLEQNPMADNLYDGSLPPEELKFLAELETSLVRRGVLPTEA